MSCFKGKNFIGEGRGGQGGGGRPPTSFGGGVHITLPNNPPTFSINVYVKQ